VIPTVLNIDGFRFHFFFDERNEPCHIHIKKGGARAKILLVPDYNEEYFYDFTKVKYCIL
jgi:hypothetical protein